MVTNQATIKRDGVQDWVSLRATALIIMLFSFYIGWFFITTETVTYDVWQGFFGSLTTKVFTLAALVSVMLHVRIGLWQLLCASGDKNCTELCGCSWYESGAKGGNGRTGGCCQGINAIFAGA